MKKEISIQNDFNSEENKKSKLWIITIKFIVVSFLPLVVCIDGLF